MTADEPWNAELLRRQEWCAECGARCGDRESLRLVDTPRICLLFADVKGDSTSLHVGEDEDTYRFVHEAAANVGAELVTVKDGRDIWQVFRDDRFLGNSRLANCSKYLKQKPCRDWLEANCDPSETTVYVGIDWSESHRLPAIEAGWHPYPVKAPLTEPPYLDRDDVQAMCRAAGIEVPRLYRAGFAHNNCGGFCVRAGQAQMELLLREHPERYAYAEDQEQRLRAHLDKDVAVLRDRAGGNSTPLTLTRFRERIEAQPSMFDPYDLGGCGCFTETPIEVYGRPAPQGSKRHVGNGSQA